MNTPRLRFFVIILLIILFNYLFWQEKAGINLLIFNSLLILSLVYFSGKTFSTMALKTSLGLTIIAGLMIVLHNSVVSSFVFIGSFFILVGFLHRNQLSTVTSALWQYGLNSLFTTFEQFGLFSSYINTFTEKNKHLKRGYITARIIIIPLIVFSVFVLIFKFANPVFGELLDNSFSGLFHAIDSFFQNFSLPRLIFIAIGIFFIVNVLFSWERTNAVHPLKIRSELIAKPEALNLPKLETEYKTALILIGSLNLLLLLINIIDIRFLWFNINSSLKSAPELSKLVHEGTNLLILSILLSITILLYYFRRDLNFFINNRWLVVGSYIWIIQNGILVISVLLRNYEYILNYGLTHKRIGVAVFLLIISIGLVLLWLKIRNLFSFFKLFKLAGWAGYFVIVSLTLFDWDSMIARYNLRTQNAESLDYNYLFSLSDRTLPILYENRQKIEESMSKVPDITHEKVVEKLNRKVYRYLAEQQKYSWVSWDFSNSKATDYFKDKEVSAPASQF